MKVDQKMIEVGLQIKFFIVKPESESDFMYKYILFVLSSVHKAGLLQSLWVGGFVSAGYLSVGGLQPAEDPGQF